MPDLGLEVLLKGQNMARLLGGLYVGSGEGVIVAHELWPHGLGYVYIVAFVRVR